jgi:hypothetical protein
VNVLYMMPIRFATPPVMPTKQTVQEGAGN